MTNEQINAEIEELTKENDRLLVSAKEIFAECGRIKVQIQLLERLRSVRTDTIRSYGQTSLVVLGVFPNEEEAPISFCAFSWEDDLISPKRTKLFLRSDWESVVPSEILAYFRSLVEDWKALLRTKPEMLLAFATGLSVGPVRTIETMVVQQDRVPIMVRQRLGKTVQFPAEVAPIYEPVIGNNNNGDGMPPNLG